jgi:hypothetical protein
MSGHEHIRPELPADWPQGSTRTPDMVMFDLLAEMAKEPGSGMTEIAPGVWHSVDLTETESTACPFCRQKRWEEEGHGWISGPCEPTVDPRGVWLDTGSGPGYVFPPRP